MPVFEELPPVAGKVSLTEDEQAAIHINKTRPWFRSDEENENRRVKFEETAIGVGKDVMSKLVARGDHGLDPKTAGSSLSTLTGIAYNIARDVDLGPTRTEEFVLGAVKGAFEELAGRQYARFNELMQSGIYG